MKKQRCIESGSSDIFIGGVDGDFDEPLISHLAELRDRSIAIILVMFLFICVLYPFSELILQHMWHKFFPDVIGMTVYSPLEWIFLRIRLSFLMAVIFVFPFVFYEGFRFASRGLYPNERRFCISIVPVSFIFFLLGAIIALLFIVPMIFDNVVLYSGMIADDQISVAKAISVVITLVMGSGLVFQVPVLMFFATKMGLVECRTLRKMRILVYGSILAFALSLSPDPTFIAQFICALLLVILFEIGLLVSR
ncbi:preprotein translocase subunit TatC [Methanococcoides sp. SA1]|nr:preprotein translocase subunit TatC [Methanococcoides sp. SA1]